MVVDEASEKQNFLGNLGKTISLLFSNNFNNEASKNQNEKINK